jgi:hypothetical protein
MNISEGMKLSESLSSILGVDEKAISINESFYNLDIKINISESFHIKGNDILFLNELIKDDFQIDFLYCDSSDKTFNKSDIFLLADKFAKEIEEKLKDLDFSDPDDLQVINSFKIQISIRKKIADQILCIYNFSAFCKYWGNLSWKDRLTALSESELKKGVIFYLLEGNILPFKTEGFYFTNDVSIKPHLIDCIEDVRENVYWCDIDMYPLTPISFHFIERPLVNNIFVNTFDTLSIFFSLCTLFDITTISENGEKLKFKLCGYKNICGIFCLNQHSENLIQTESEYYKLFRWVYIGEGNKSDKIGIVRNILSLFINSNNINIQENVFVSVKSSFKTYLKENLNKYVAIRNQIFQELDSIIALSSTVKKDFLDGFKKNLLACITFFMSTLVLKVIVNDSTSKKIFSSKIALLSYAVFFISFLYMLWMKKDIDNEKKNIVKRYSILKERYSDLLIPEEIDVIFRHGEELNDQLSYIDDIKKRYALLWEYSLFVLFFVVTILSDIGSYLVQFLLYLISDFQFLFNKSLHFFVNLCSF